MPVSPSGDVPVALCVCVCARARARCVRACVRASERVYTSMDYQSARPVPLCWYRTGANVQDDYEDDFEAGSDHPSEQSVEIEEESLSGSTPGVCLRRARAKTGPRERLSSACSHARMLACTLCARVCVFACGIAAHARRSGGGCQAGARRGRHGAACLTRAGFFLLDSRCSERHGTSSCFGWCAMTKRPLCAHKCVCAAGFHPHIRA